MKGTEGFEAIGPQPSPETCGFPIEAWEVQGTLMLLSYREAHKHDQHPPMVDLIHPEQTEMKIAEAAGDEWVAESEQGLSFAKAFRAYSDAHPHQVINISDEHALASLLAELAVARKSSDVSPTLH